MNLGALVKARLRRLGGRFDRGGDPLVLNGGLERARAAVARGAVVILAIGSSSIEGVGASRPALGAVPQLEAGLRRRLREVEIAVVNRGVGGESADEAVARMSAELEAVRPDLVLWQLGVNDVLRERPFAQVTADLRRGAAMVRAFGADLILIDPQRLPEDSANDYVHGRNGPLRRMARLIEAEAARLGLGVVRRFEAMRGWAGLPNRGYSPDDLHFNDAGYARWAEMMAESLAEVLRPNARE